MQPVDTRGKRFMRPRVVENLESAFKRTIRCTHERHLRCIALNLSGLYPRSPKSIRVMVRLPVNRQGSCGVSVRNGKAENRWRGNYKIGCRVESNLNQWVGVGVQMQGR